MKHTPLQYQLSGIHVFVHLPSFIERQVLSNKGCSFKSIYGYECHNLTTEGGVSDDQRGLQQLTIIIYYIMEGTMS